MKPEEGKEGQVDTIQLELPRKGKGKNPKLFLDPAAMIEEEPALSAAPNSMFTKHAGDSAKMHTETAIGHSKGGQIEKRDYQLPVSTDDAQTGRFPAEITQKVPSEVFKTNPNAISEFEPANQTSEGENKTQSSSGLSPEEAKRYQANPRCLETLATDVSAQIIVSLSPPVQRLMLPVEADKLLDYSLHRKPHEEWQILNVMCESGRHKAALVPLAMRMNRHTEIKVFEHNMVAVDDKDATSFEDWYINANYIRDPYLGGSKANFIATQGPLPNTMLNFWKMIDRENITKIFMLSCLMEGGKKKCDAYWPVSAQSSLVVEKEYEILLESEELGAENFFTRRVFRLTNQETGKIKVVEQIHIQGWPDHSVPAASGQFILNQFIEDLVHHYDFASQGPILVHCSAGVGRTGTFIALFYLRKCILLHKLLGIPNPALSIFSLVRNLKEQRYFFIRESAQYNLLYKTAAQWLKESIN